MRPSTLLELAASHGVRLPEALRTAHPLDLRPDDERGWFRFQRLYEAARAVIRTPSDVQRIILEAAEDDAADGSGWLELQVDPSGYAARLGGLTRALETVLEAAGRASAITGVGIGIVVGANRTKHPLEARTLARLAARYSGSGVVGFGLANDERRGATKDFAPAFAIARRAGLMAVPHGGELLGADSVRQCLELLGARRVGHGVAAAQDPALLDRLAAEGVALEVCPASNVALGVFATPADVPLRRLFAAEVPIALGADDPLLFGSRLAEQYEYARAVHGFADAELAALARSSVLASLAPQAVRDRLLQGIDRWLAAPDAPDEKHEGRRAAGEGG